MVYDYLPLDSKLSEPLYQQLTQAIRLAVEEGNLKPGARLPSIRKLSEDLHISRTTVDTAYQQLCVEGYLRAKPQRGYFVQELKRPVEEAAPERVNFPADAPAFPIRYDFGTGSVDGAASDGKIWRRHVRDVLNRPRAITSYGDPQGEPTLRRALSAYSYGARGVTAGAERIVVGAGTQPLLYLLCGLLPERRVALEERGFPQAERVFADCGVTIVRLPSDEDGISLKALRESGVRQALISPSNPVAGGTAMPMSRRYELLDWAQGTGGILLEDDYNGELRYNARPIPSLQGSGGNVCVVYLGSFSKLLLPSVRVGYMALPPALLPLYRERAGSYNQTASKVEQLALAEYISSGQMERHLRRLRKLYAAKSARLLQCLQVSFPTAEITLAETSLFAVIAPPASCSAGELCQAAAQNGVRAQPLPGMPARVRLGFSGIPLEEIPPAVKALEESWCGLLREGDCASSSAGVK